MMDPAPVAAAGQAEGDPQLHRHGDEEDEGKDGIVCGLVVGEDRSGGRLVEHGGEGQHKGEGAQPPQRAPQLLYRRRRGERHHPLQHVGYAL